MLFLAIAGLVALTGLTVWAMVAAWSPMMLSMIGIPVIVAWFIALNVESAILGIGITLATGYWAVMDSLANSTSRHNPEPHRVRVPRDYIVLKPQPVP